MTRHPYGSPEERQLYLNELISPYIDEFMRGYQDAADKQHPEVRRGYGPVAALRKAFPHLVSEDGTKFSAGKFWLNLGEKYETQERKRWDTDKA